MERRTPIRHTQPATRFTHHIIMPVSIKAQILQKILDLLADTQNTCGVRKITRTRNLTLNEPVRPAIQIYAGPEKLMAKDNRGRTYHFDIGIKCLVEDARDVDGQLDVLVPESQRILDSNVQLVSLSVMSHGVDEC